MAGSKEGIASDIVGLVVSFLKMGAKRAGRSKMLSYPRSYHDPLDCFMKAQAREEVFAHLICDFAQDEPGPRPRLEMVAEVSGSLR